MESSHRLDDAIKAISKEALHLTGTGESTVRTTTSADDVIRIRNTGGTSSVPIDDDYGRRSSRLSSRRLSAPVVQAPVLRKITEEQCLDSTRINDPVHFEISSQTDLNTIDESPENIARQRTPSPSSPRFDRMHLQPSISHDGGMRKESDNSTFELKEHRLYVQVDELKTIKTATGDVVEHWQPLGRWIKYEEAFESTNHRWSKAKVSCLSFNGLLQLVALIEHGAVSLDVHVDDFESTLELLVNQLIDTNQISHDQIEQLITTLSTHATSSANPIHLHQQQSHSRRSSTLVRGALNHVDGHSNTRIDNIHLQPIREEEQSNPLTFNHQQHPHNHSAIIKRISSQISIAGSVSPSGGRQILQRRRSHHDVQRRMPPGSESAFILVAQIDYISKPVCVFLRLQNPIDVIQTPLPMRYIATFFVPKSSPIDHIEIGRSMATLLSNKLFRESLHSTTHNRDGMIRAINEFISDTVVLPAGDWNKEELMHSWSEIISKSHAIKERRRALAHGRTHPTDIVTLYNTRVKEHSNHVQKDPFQRTGRLFGGLRIEVSRRLRFYLSDWTDALNFKCLSCILFLFLTCFFPALTYGAILKTHGQIGLTETHLATSIFGIVFALFSGQPMLLVGVCGPMLIFEGSVYMLCSARGYAYLQFRIWISIWALVACIVAVAFEGPLLINYVTRFSDDILTVLIAFMYIYDSIKYLKRMFMQHPMMKASGYCNLTSAFVTTDYQSTTPQPNTALICCLLMFGTCIVAFVMRSIRFSKYFGRQFRMVIGDLGLTIAIIV